MLTPSSLLLLYCLDLFHTRIYLFDWGSSWGSGRGGI